MNSHPGRYPKHDDPDKGQVYAGECNTTRCSNRDATWWNLWTYGLYCKGCAGRINYKKDKSPLCIKVDAKPELSEMEDLKRNECHDQAIVPKVPVKTKRHSGYAQIAMAAMAVEAAWGADYYDLQPSAEPSRQKQNTAYQAPPRNDELHIQAAAQKRARRAEKLRKIHSKKME